MSRGRDGSSGIARRLASLATDEGVFAILAIDHGRSFLNMLGDDTTEAEPLTAIKGAVLDLLGAHCTAVLVDVDMAGTAGEWRPPDGVGLIVGLDEFDYDDVACPPPRVPPRELLRDLLDAGASCAKIVLYYDPASPEARVRLDAVALVADRCHGEGLPLLVEPLPLPGLDRDGGAPWPVVEVARQAATTGADILKLPLALEPRSGEIAAEITEASGSTPWILLSSGAPYPDFLEILRLSMLGGAAGFSAGRSIWGDLISNVTDDTARRDAIQRLETAAELTRSLGRTLRA